MAATKWLEELWAGRTALALGLLQEERESPGKLYSLGSVYMWTYEFQMARSYFEKLLDKPDRSDFFFGMAGTAAWCTGEKKLATRHWRKGVSAPRTVGGANTRTALLLYAASVLEPGTYSTESAIKILRTRADQWRVRNWPGPIAQLILGKTTEDGARQASRNPIHRNSLKSAIWKFRFYVLLRQFLSCDMNPSAFREELRRLVAVEGSEYICLENLFYFLRCEELYLARNWCSTH